MAKTRKRDSRRPSQKKIKKMEERRQAEELARKHEAERARYSIPESNSEDAVEMCRQRVRKEGKLCYCKEKCGCRACQARRDVKWDLEHLKSESVGCHFGCYKCSEHNPCY